MLTIEKIDMDNISQVKRFVELPHGLYKDCPQWVPLINIDAYTYLNRKKHPFHEHSDMDFFLHFIMFLPRFNALKDGCSRLD